MSNGNQHDHDPLPVVLAGGAASQLKGGRHVQTAPHTPMSNLLLSMLDKLGVPADKHGDSIATLAGAWPEFPTVEELRKGQAAAAQREPL